MGIPRLASSLEPFAVQHTARGLQGNRKAIIDGPALAYHAFNLAAESQPGVPSYTDINEAAIDWLRRLEQNNIKVWREGGHRMKIRCDVVHMQTPAAARGKTKIFFDGALPSWKKEERISRLQQSLSKLFKFKANIDSAESKYQSLGAVATPFLVPSLVEKLLASEFSESTSVVPGEADEWCAFFASNNPHSIIFTGDSDLLVYEFGPNVWVVLLKDVDLLPSLVFKSFCPNNIALRLRLKSLVPLAYAMAKDPFQHFNDSIADARRCDTETPNYIQFRERYALSPMFPAYQTDYPELNIALQKTDVRVSELAHQIFPYCLLGLQEVDIFTFDVYLPFLVEDIDRSSAWSHAEEIRFLGYSFLASITFAETSVQEYKRRAQAVVPRKHELYSLEKAQSKATALIAMLKSWVDTHIHLSPVQIWSLFAIRFVLVDLASPDKPLFSSALLARIITGDTDGTLNFIHVSARVHAVLYSLRILYQCITICIAMNKGFFLFDSSELFAVISGLHQALQSLPGIDELFPTPGTALKRLDNDTELLQAIAKVYESLGIGEEPLPKAKMKKQREKDRKESVQKEKSSEAAGNMYNVLRSMS
ncbi:hypothetical protein K469DRAFT_696929 [Zopfia rhizophila CBS 207.26]|uniref:Asteroid domain-containing protein n=1 Tax=Zopfia rhizophila CBS 207.26 TaxID=1314779 RepID=A0A6A6EKF2_9PEZI|nr:hypothetical protein K469DRAFT_696929 [Zopfia rhizophila CBS 207.26]